MTSPFWTYFADKLHWPQAFAPGPLQAIVRGLAHHLDTTREDMPYLRQQFFPGLCEDDLVPEHGLSRSLVRHPRETPEQFRQRVVHAYRWHMLGGKTSGLPQILKFYGFPAAQLDNLGEYSRARWAEFDLKLDSPESVDEYNAMLADVGQLIWLVNEYKAARSVLARVYTDIHDRRPIVLSAGPVLGDGYLSHFSGIAAPEMGTTGNTQLSFGFRYQGFSPAHVHTGLFGWLELHTLLSRRLNRFIVGLSRLSDVYGTSKPFIFTNLFSLGAGHERVSRGFGTARQAKAQAVPTEGFDVLGGSNYRLGTTWIEIPGRRFGVGLSALSGDDGRSQRVRVDELLAAASGFTAARGMRPEPVGFSWDVTDQFVARRMTRFVLGLSRLSDVHIENQPFLFDSLLSLGAEHERLSRSFGARRQAKAQAVFSEGFDVLGGSNFRLGTAWRTVAEPPFVLGSSALSGVDGQTRRVRVDEVLTKTEGIATEPRERPDSGVGGLAFEVALRTEARRPRMRWSHEPWAHRRWWERTAFVNLNQEEETL